MAAPLSTSRHWIVRVLDDPNVALFSGDVNPSELAAVHRRMGELINAMNGANYFPSGLRFTLEI